MAGSVIVIGGGAAGALAALAARRAGLDVALVRRSPGASAVSSGAFDLASGLDAQARPLGIVEAARAMARWRPWHPYARLGPALVPVLARAQELLVTELSALGVRGASDGSRNLQLVTPLGTMKITALAQGSIARGDLADWPAAARIAVVGVREASGFDAGLVAAGLRSGGREAVAALVDLPLGPHAGAGELASFLDAPGGRAAFVAKAWVSAQAVRATCALVPTAGLTDPMGLCDALEGQGFERAAELVGVPPAVPGLRLDRALVQRLEAAGVTVVTASVAAATVEGGRVVRLRLDDGRELSAEAFVLASGRFIGGGIRHDGTFRETVFGLPVFVDDQDVGDAWLGGLLDAHAAAGQPALRAGVRVDAAMRPVDDRGRVVLGNLFAAGSVVGGYDAAKDGSGLGVAAVTALVAGEHAAAAVDPTRAMLAPA